MKPVTRYTLATVTLLLTSCGQEEGKGTPADQGEQSAAVQAVTPSPAADTPAPQPEPEPEVEPAAESSDEPAVLPEPAPSPEPTPTPETDASGESDPEPMPTPEAIDPGESDPEPTAAPETADPGESDPEPMPTPEAIDAAESNPEPTILAGGDLAPENLGDKTVVFNYESSQYKYSEDGEDVSGWQSYQNAKKNVKSCAEVFIIVGLNPEATRNILSPNTTANGDKYVYRKTGPNTGTLDVSRSNSDRTYTITFTSPTTGTATEEIFVGSMQGNVRNIRFVIPGPETVDPGESDPEPMPTPEAIDPGESDPEPTPAPETADPEESDPEPTTSAGGDLAPENLVGKTAVFNYESSQYKYSEDGENVSGWQSYQNAKKNVKSCAEAFIAVGLKPKATRNILPLNTPAKGGKYVYRKTGPNTGTIEVSSSNSARTYTITFTSPTTGTATEEIFVGSMQGNVRNIQVSIK
ncbi:MAG: hypothetical protein Q4F38_05585 [Akkermansia sp.]|nr:hypothetical protein [Akkermansia sp.]